MTKTLRIKRLSARQNNLRRAQNLKLNNKIFCYFVFKESIQVTVLLGHDFALKNT